MNHLKINEIEYLKIEDLLLIHSAIIDETGGSHRVRDIGRLEAIVQRPQQIVLGREILVGIFKKASGYAHDIIKYHPFVDGNKKNGMIAMGVFLELNGYLVMAKKGEIEKLALSIVIDNLNDKQISRWLKKHSKRVDGRKKRG